MSVISQSIADVVAEKLVEHLRDEYKEIHKELRTFAYNLVKKDIPQEVLSCFENHRSYFEPENNFAAFGFGLNHEWVSIEPWLPLPSRSIEIKSQSDADVIRKLLDKSKDKDKEIKEFKSSIYNTLLTLKTYKQIEANFPEAAQHLPKSSGRMLPTIQLQEIRTKLNSTKKQ